MVRTVALLFRGICSSEYVDAKDMARYRVCYRDSIHSLTVNLFNANPDVRFDLFGFGWTDGGRGADDVRRDFGTIPNVRVCDVDVRAQKSFADQFEETIGNHAHVLRSVFQFRPNTTIDPKHVHTRDHFQNQFSYFYAVEKAATLVPPESEYDLFCCLRWDIDLVTPVDLQALDFSKKKLFINTQPAHSPVFLGDFFIISDRNLFTVFFQFYKEIMRQSSALYPDIEVWMKLCIDNAVHYSPHCRYSLSCYTHQAILAYFLSRNDVVYEDIDHSICCRLNKTRITNSL